MSVGAPCYARSLVAARREAKRRWGKSATIKATALGHEVLIASRSPEGLPVLHGRGRTLVEAWADADRMGVPVRGGAIERVTRVRNCKYVADAEGDFLSCACEFGKHVCGSDYTTMVEFQNLLPEATLGGVPGDFEIIVRYTPKQARRR